jgi:hypothetical protein
MMARRGRKKGRKQAQGISINVIIVAAIALLVLVVLSVIFLGRFNIFSQETASCESQGGQCIVGSCPQGMATFKAWTCTPDAGVVPTCCVAAG